MSDNEEKHFKKAKQPRKLLTEEERQKRLDNLKKGRETAQRNRELKKNQKQEPTKELPKEEPEPAKPPAPDNDILNKLVALLDSRLPQKQEAPPKKKREYKPKPKKEQPKKPLHDNTKLPDIYAPKQAPTKPVPAPFNAVPMKKGRLSAKEIYNIAMTNF